MLKRQLIFHGTESTWWLILCVAAVAVALALIYVLMRYERKLVPKKIGNTLFVLRSAVLVALLFTLLEPVLSWTLDRERTGRILVGIDLSDSMTTADNHATKAEKLRWARALGMIGNVAINSRLDRWAVAFENQEEPQWVDEGETSDPERRRSLAQGRQENLDGIFQELDRISRKEIALRLLTKTTNPLLAKLQEVANVELEVFAGTTESADEETLEKFVNNPPERVSTDHSNLADALASAAVDVESSPVLGVLLFTDGRDNSDHDPLAVALRLRDLSTPVYPVLLGSELRPKDLAIAALDYPQTAYKDDRPLLKATLNTAGFEGEELTIILEQTGTDPIEKTITPAGEVAEIEFELDAANLGRHEYTIRTPARPGETRQDNNRKSFAMNVVDDKARVLLVEGEARWEFRFIDNALTRDERVDVKQVLFQQPYLGVLPQRFFENRLELPTNPDDLEHSPFAEPDLVIIGDVPSNRFNDTAQKLLEKFVAESGGTVVFIAGKRHFPLSYRSDIIDQLVPLTNLRPVNITDASGRGSPNERGFRLKLTPEGENESILQFDADPVTNRNIWNGLPGHLWGLMGTAKPGATVLAYGFLSDEEPSLEAERRGALIVHQHYGFGQVVWIGIDSTWRWRHRVGDQYHHRFWGQVARWAASNKASVGNEFVKFGPDRTDIEVGEDAIIRARWTQNFLRKFPNLKARVEIYREDGKPSSKLFSMLELTPVETRPIIHEGRVVSLPAGAYRIKLVTDDADLGPEEIATSLYVHEKQTPELSNLSSNRNLLTQLAEATGGRLFFPDQVHEIPQLFQNPDLTLTIREETTLWDHWFILTVFFTLLTSEWVIRKLNGLP